MIPSLPTYPEPLIDSYTYHSKCPTTPGKYIMGVDEAGRGPVLGPLVYGVAFCPASEEYSETLDGFGFNDSKQLNAQTRDRLMESLSSDPENLGFAVRVISPQDLSLNMQSRPPINLNVQSQNATIGLISLVLDTLNLEISELYVDALGPPVPYQRMLAERFPQIGKVVVEAKADAKYTIVGAASVAAKVTRDAWIEGWVFTEDEGEGEKWGKELGSGYPSDPKTQAWIAGSVDPVFGYPSLARFSWATIKVQLDKSAHKVVWTDDGQTIARSFETAKARDKGRCAIAKDLAIRGVGSL